MKNNKKEHLIFDHLYQQFQLLSQLLSGLTDSQYNHKIVYLGHASIGEHTRHIIELMQCAIHGYKTGQIDYVNRSRNLQLETDRLLALALINQLEAHTKVPDRQLNLLVDTTEGSNKFTNINTSYYREIVYNTEHIIHHLALIKVAVIDLQIDLVDNNFGMAYSTIKYKRSLQNS